MENNDAKYVPDLHSNQISVENYFPCIRVMDYDKIDLYVTGVQYLNVLPNIKEVKIFSSNSSYPIEPLMYDYKDNFTMYIDIIKYGT